MFIVQVTIFKDHFDFLIGCVGDLDDRLDVFFDIIHVSRKNLGDVDDHIQFLATLVDGSLCFGNFDCRGVDTCPIQVLNTGFSETFIAVPDPGYEFIGWRRAPGYLCGGLTGACPLSTAGFDRFPALLQLLESDAVYKLTPVFRRPPTPDYNGDGFADLAVVASGEEPFGELLQVLYGSPQGLLAEGHTTIGTEGVRRGFERLGQLISRDPTIFVGLGAGFANSLTDGDFNGDGFSDLALGFYGFRAYVLYGSEQGLATQGQQRWTSGPNPSFVDPTGRGVIEDAIRLVTLFAEGRKGEEFAEALRVAAHGFRVHVRVAVTRDAPAVRQRHAVVGE